MAILHLDNALFWAFLIFIASYIPVSGAPWASWSPPIFALVQFESFWPAIILLGCCRPIRRSWSATSSCRACRATA